jgi:hypothetical protein
MDGQLKITYIVQGLAGWDRNGAPTETQRSCVCIINGIRERKYQIFMGSVLNGVKFESHFVAPCTYIYDVRQRQPGNAWETHQQGTSSLPRSSRDKRMHAVTLVVMLS